MASVDLGALKASIKLTGVNDAKKQLSDLAAKFKSAKAETEKSTGVMDGFKNTLMNSLSNVNIFGTSLGGLAEGLASSEAASLALGTALGGACLIGINLAIKAVGALAQGCVDFVKSSMQVGENFEYQMAKVGAISQSTDGDLQKLTDSARTFAKDSVFSSQQVAEAMEYTALAGYDTNETLSALPGILNLAQASSMDLAKASDILTDNITAFGLSTEDSAHFADVMAYAMSNSNTSTEELGEAYKNCATTAALFNMTAEETTAVLGKLADAGKKGGEAGTALNAILVNLTKDKVVDMLDSYGIALYDAAGNGRDFTDILGDMQKATANMTDEEARFFAKTVAGKEHISSFNILMNTSADTIREFTKELENSDGAAEEMARRMNNTIKGLKASISSKLEDIKISIFNIIDPIYGSILKIGETLLNSIVNTIKPIATIIGAALTPVFQIVSSICDIFQLIGNTVAAVINPIVNATAALLKFSAVGESLEGLYAVIKSVIDLIGTLWQLLQLGVSKVLKMLKEELQPILDILNPILEKIGKVISAFINLGKTIAGAINDFSAKIKQWIKDNSDVEESNEDLADSTEEAYNNIETMSDDLREKVGDNFANLYDEIMGMDGECWNTLKDNAQEYTSMMDVEMDALSEYEKDTLNKRVKAWEESHKAMEGTQTWYLNKAKYTEQQRQQLEKQTAKTREQIQISYTNKLQSEVNKQKKIQEQTTVSHVNEYKKDYQEFAKNEEAKTKKFQSEAKKRSGSGSSKKGLLSGILGGFANGTLSVNQSGMYRVGEFGPETVFLPKGAKVQQGGNATSNSNVYNITIDASRVKEFNDIIKMCNNYKQMARMGVQ